MSLFSSKTLAEIGADLQAVDQIASGANSIVGGVNSSSGDPSAGSDSGFSLNDLAGTLGKLGGFLSNLGKPPEKAANDPGHSLAAPAKAAAGSPWTMPLILGGGALVLFLLLRR